ncbi:MAG: serine/threonine kinase [Labilithrix sp.]|nr:serine/threonine kinase [Labilithrix sp.]
MRFAAAIVGLGFACALAVVTDARADGGAATAPATPDDMILDLGGQTLATRRVTHGSFTMGSAPGDPGHEKDEEPAHQVTISKDFWIGKFPVTRGQFAKFVSDTRYVTDAEKGPSGGSGWEGKSVDGGKPGLVQKKDFTWRNPGFVQTDEHPVVLVSYGDANAFVGWASRKSGKRVRLPTEAEWEFAIRGGTTTPHYGGAAAEGDLAAYGWFKHNAGNGTRPVGQKKPNPLGIFDMSGNVMEWCRDIYAPYKDAPAVDPESATNAPGEQERRVLRGGSWFRDVKRGRSAARYKNAPGSRNADNGFRVVVTNEETVVPGMTGAGGDFAPASPIGVSGTLPAAPTASSSTGPLSDGEPLRLEPVAQGNDAFSWGLLLASPVAAASAAVAWMLLRRKRTPGVAANAGGISTRAVADGFFVSAADVKPGSRIRYACMVNGTEVSDVVPFDGGAATFVYTGAHPTAIRILEVIAGARGGYRAADRPPAESDLVPPSSSSPRPPPPPPSSRRAPPLPAKDSQSRPPPMPAKPAVPPQTLLTRPSSDPLDHDSPRLLSIPFIDSNALAESASRPDAGTTDDLPDAGADIEPTVPIVPGGEKKPPPPLPSKPAAPDSKPAADSSTTSATSTTSTTGDTSEPFLGNPRAY